MGRRITIYLLLIFLCCCSCGPATTAVDDGNTIPIDSVWAYMMPGTRDIARLETQYFSEDYAKLEGNEQLKRSKESVLLKIRKVLRHMPKDGPKPAFAVAGSGIDALNEAYAVLSGAKPVQKEFLAGGDISIFIFSYQASSYVHLRSIERTQDVFRINLEYIAHTNLRMTEHFALIPAGILSPGKFQVAIEGADAGIVCQSFSFTVSNQPTE